MRRCPGCGAWYQGDECPNQHPEGRAVRSDPATPASRVGEWTTLTLDGVECPALIVSDCPLRVCVFGPGDVGHVSVRNLEETP